MGWCWWRLQGSDYADVGDSSIGCHVDINGENDDVTVMMIMGTTIRSISSMTTMITTKSADFIVVFIQRWNPAEKRQQRFQ